MVEVRIVRGGAVPFAHELWVVLEARADVDEAFEAQPVEQTEDLELPLQQLERVERHATRAAVRFEDAGAPVVAELDAFAKTLLEPGARALLDGQRRVVRHRVGRFLAHRSTRASLRWSPRPAD